ncbi:MAG: hypothetical protein ACI9OJ_005199 [Myxococcota bacterium]|jgi:hypothetical protein
MVLTLREKLGFHHQAVSVGILATFGVFFLIRGITLLR